MKKTERNSGANPCAHPAFCAGTRTVRTPRGTVEVIAPTDVPLARLAQAFRPLAERRVKQ